MPFASTQMYHVFEAWHIDHPPFFQNVQNKKYEKWGIL